MFFYKLKHVFVLVYATIILNYPAQASGFSVHLSSIPSLGAGTAGLVTSLDASSVTVNPATALDFSDGMRVGLVYNLVAANSDFHNINSLVPEFPLAGWPLSLSATSTIKKMVPSFFVVWPVRNTISAGFILQPVLGGVIDYPEWVGQFYSRRSSLSVVKGAALLAFKLSPTWHLGVSLSLNKAALQMSRVVNLSAALAMRLQELDPTLDIRSACQVGFPTLFSTFQTPICIEPLYLTATLSGDDVKWGATIGSVIHLSPELTLGAQWTGGVALRLHGEVLFSKLNLPQYEFVRELTGFSGPTSLINRFISFPMNVPQQFSLGLKYMPLSDWTFLIDYRYEQWSSLNEIVINDAMGEVARVPFHWSNAHAVALGLQYQMSSELSFRAGGFYEDSVLSSQQISSLANYDGARHGASVGGQYCHNNTCWDISLLYSQRAPAHVSGVGSVIIPFTPYPSGTLSVETFAAGLQVQRKF